MTYQQYPGGSYPSGRPHDGVPGSFGYQQGYLQPQRPPKRPVWPWIVGGLGFFCLLFFGGCVYFIAVFADGPAGAASSFARDLEDRDLGSAYNQLCAASQQQIPFEGFAADYVPDKPMRSVESSNDASLTGGDSTTDAFVAEITYEDGTREDLRYDLVKEDDEWRVCNPPRPRN